MLLVFLLLASVCFICLLRLWSLRNGDSASLPLLSMDEIRKVAEYADPTTATHLGAVNMSLRRVAPIRLNKQYSAFYISNPEFRAHVNSRRSNARGLISLNLGKRFLFYIVDSNFRALVDGLVSDPGTQVWSDVEKLSLFRLSVEDISPLACLPNLQELHSGNTLVKGLGPLARLYKLKELNLARSQVRNITPLAGLKNLRRLDLSNTQVQNIDALAGLKNMQWLNLRFTHVQDISPLAGLTRLQELNLRGTLVDVRSLPYWRSLYIHR